MAFAFLAIPKLEYSESTISEQAEIEKRSKIRIFTEVFMLLPLTRDIYFLLSEFFLLILTWELKILREISQIPME
jgi:hypothetical protein